MDKKEILKKMSDLFLNSADAANSAELAYVMSVKEKNKAKQKQQQKAEREL